MDPRFDEFLHVPARLSILALLAPAAWVDFGFLRDTIGTSDSALSKHISALAEAGYVTVRKDQQRRARRTFVQLTPHGRHAFQRHAAALEQIVAAARAPTAPDSPAGEPAPAP
ncbi:DNA-binding transcriptional regulator, MarR family [Micromonospora coriariae]|uniref:DNA-binding transcriptional regulator, MarR family n=1 Tax=Micromonospora coriariae TaxID=285665 RepID=A0A1C4X9R1_9ACTN|nr:transcriptional regulator [Micromonospora coriariae]SCF05283.1 DNA-binding transcriptional regulator, MarR family [Micromonospora coriariae]